jgi:hypothetical protein
MSNESLQVYRQIIRDVVNTLGIPFVILIAIFAIWVGWIPSPLSEAKVVVDTIQQSVSAHAAHDREVLFYLRQTCLANKKLAQQPPEDCLFKE